MLRAFHTAGGQPDQMNAWVVTLPGNIMEVERGQLDDPEILYQQTFFHFGDFKECALPFQ